MEKNTNQVHEKETIIKENKNKKNNKIKKPNEKVNKVKRFFYGVGKEFERVTWTNKRELITSFIIIIVVVCFFAIIFTLISIGVTSI